jgi:hypothetical protein
MWTETNFNLGLVAFTMTQRLLRKHLLVALVENINTDEKEFENFLVKEIQPLQSLCGDSSKIEFLLKRTDIFYQKSQLLATP